MSAKQVIGASPKSQILADVGDITRFADRNRFASWTGTAPLDASSVRTTGTGSRGPGTDE